jgi:glycosyltransferase involved in cell wall biosynthesis
MTTPLVSIAMCTYNGEKYLKQQLDSLLKQTYTNLEIIITDDGSKDGTMGILNQYASNDSRIKVFQNETNLGFVQNFSKAISLCNGDFIALADQDDIWKSTKIEVFVNNIGNNTLIYSDAQLMDENNTILDKQLIRPGKNLVSGACNKAFFFYNCVSGNTLMFKKELLESILPIPAVSFHDIWIAFIASSLGTITYTDEPMTYYRRHQEQVTKTKPKSEKNYRIFFHRFNIKSTQKTNDVKQFINDFTIYRDFLISIGDIKTTNLLNALLYHFIHYEKIFMNLTLRRMLIESSDELFAILSPKKRRQRAKRFSMGLKFHQSTLFL